jgi:hypothetical protein
MVQIIGWLGCLYLFVKGWEIAGNQANQVKTSKQLAAEENFEKTGRGKPPNPPLTRLSVPALIAMICAWSGAAVFPVMINSQAEQLSTAKQPAPSFSECLRQAETVAEIRKCQAH